MTTAAVDRIRDRRVVAIVRSQDLSVDDAVAIAGTLAAAGLDVVEFTCNSARPFAAIAAVAERFGDDVLVGAGTVRAVADVRRAADAGGRFVVAPDLDERVVRAAHDLGLAALPGAYTPTEVGRAVTAGGDLVKLFPANPAGPDYLRALRGPFPEVPLVPTGGIAIDDVAGFLAAGAVAVGLGSVLVPATDPLEGLRERAERVRAAIGLDR